MAALTAPGGDRPWRSAAGLMEDSRRETISSTRYDPSMATRMKAVSLVENARARNAALAYR